MSAPAHQQELGAAADRARAVLQVHPDDAQAWIALANWYASRRVEHWAIECFERARQSDSATLPSDAAAPSPVLAHCYWQQSRAADARQEFQRLLAEATNPDERLYLTLCVRAVDSALNDPLIKPKPGPASLIPVGE